VGFALVSDDPSVVMARIETKLDTALRTLADHETRIRWSERTIWLALGAGAASGGAIGAVVTSAFQQ